MTDIDYKEAYEGQKKLNKDLVRENKELRNEIGNIKLTSWYTEYLDEQIRANQNAKQIQELQGHLKLERDQTTRLLRRIDSLQKDYAATTGKYLDLQKFVSGLKPVDKVLGNDEFLPQWLKSMYHLAFYLL